MKLLMKVYQNINTMYLTAQTEMLFIIMTLFKVWHFPILSQTCYPKHRENKMQFYRTPAEKNRFQYTLDQFSS